ncbi:acetyl-CoA carboxylase biotin carboxyl carrier protein subunit [Polaromonas sp. P2-4]|nr:acetyl-CoA carboxylase biotin carboxyl carrier protein subunit [Polaromonas sp. P2-4]
MMTAELQQLAAWLAGTDIGLLELCTPQGHVRLRRDDAVPENYVCEELQGHAGAPVPVSVAASAVPATPPAVASSVGIFLHHHPLRGTPLAPPGAQVQAGQTVGLLQIGALLLPVAAPQAGVVASMLKAHGSLVGYGTALVELQPSMPPATDR